MNPKQRDFLELVKRTISNGMLTIAGEDTLLEDQRPPGVSRADALRWIIEHCVSQGLKLERNAVADFERLVKAALADGMLDDWEENLLLRQGAKMLAACEDPIGRTQQIIDGLVSETKALRREEINNACRVELASRAVRGEVSVSEWKEIEGVLTQRFSDRIHEEGNLEEILRDDLFDSRFEIRSAAEPAAPDDGLTVEAKAESVWGLRIFLQYSFLALLVAGMVFVLLNAACPRVTQGGLLLTEACDADCQAVLRGTLGDLDDAGRSGLWFGDDEKTVENLLVQLRRNCSNFDSLGQPHRARLVEWASCDARERQSAEERWIENLLVESRESGHTCSWVARCREAVRDVTQCDRVDPSCAAAAVEESEL